MYIEKYWGDYIGGTDDSMTLLEYLAAKEKSELAVGEIFADSGLDKLTSFKQTDGALSLPVEGFDAEIQFAVDMLTDLAALLLECKVNGSVDLGELGGEDCTISLTATDEEHALINKALSDFVADPVSFDLSEMMDEESLAEMADQCMELREELYGA